MRQSGHKPGRKEEFMNQLPKEYSGAVLSEGTMRTEHLLISFSSFLAMNKNFLNKTSIKKIDIILGQVEKVQKAIDDTGRFSESAISEATEILWLEIAWLLNEIAPEGTYFGSHPGDGCCYGFHDIDFLD